MLPHALIPSSSHFLQMDPVAPPVQREDHPAHWRGEGAREAGGAGREQKLGHLSRSLASCFLKDAPRGSWPYY